MRAVLHAVGRSSDVLPFVALGSRVHEVESAREAEQAVRSAAGEEGALIIVSEEFAAAGKEARGKLVIVSPGVQGSLRSALEETRRLVTRSVGVDLIAKARRTGRKDG